MELKKKKKPVGGFTNDIIGRGLMKCQSWLQHKSGNTHMNQWNATYTSQMCSRSRTGICLGVCACVRAPLCPSRRLSTVFSSRVLCLSVCQAICVYFPYMATCLAACTSPPPPHPKKKHTICSKRTPVYKFQPNKLHVCVCARVALSLFEKDAFGVKASGNDSVSENGSIVN